MRIRNNIVQSKSKIRTDIQFLRTIAIVAVVIYHIWPHALTGGFMSVDVFFVISGYLMTLTICKSIREAFISTNNITSKECNSIFKKVLSSSLFFMLGEFVD